MRCSSLYNRVRFASIISFASIVLAGSCNNANAQASSTQKESYTSKSPYSESQKSDGERSNKGLVVSGMKSGRIIETHDKIIVDGATFIGSGSDIQIKTGSKETRQVIISNSQFIAKNPNQSVINISTDSSVRIRNTKIRSHDSSIRDATCAGILCIRANGVAATDVQVDSSGNTTLSNR